MGLYWHLVEDGSTWRVFMENKLPEDAWMTLNTNWFSFVFIYI